MILKVQQPTVKEQKKGATMTSKEIKIEMIRHDVKATEIARTLNISSQAVVRGRNGLSVSRRIQKAIASSIKRPIDEVFPPKKAA